jgi:hypothetical protein
MMGKKKRQEKCRAEANELVLAALKEIPPEAWPMIFGIVEGTLRSNVSENPMVQKLRHLVNVLALARHLEAGDGRCSQAERILSEAYGAQGKA